MAAIAVASRSTFAVRSCRRRGVGQGERNLQHGEQEDRQRQVAREEPPQGSSGAASRKPTPRTVSIQPGSPSFLRRDATCTSIVFVGPYQCVSQTSSSRRWRVSDGARVGREEGEDVELLERQRQLAPVERRPAAAWSTRRTDSRRAALVCAAPRAA